MYIIYICIFIHIITKAYEEICKKSCNAEDILKNGAYVQGMNIFPARVSLPECVGRRLFPQHVLDDELHVLFSQGMCAAMFGPPDE